nr:PREDICTED: uncharacterized protein LOC107079030 isoform X1 [Lepisosteus oculatus]
MPLSSNDVTNAVAQRLKYYAEVERREDGFDLSPVEPRALTKHPLLGPGLLHDRSLKHYFSEVGVRAALQLRGQTAGSARRSQPEPSPPRQLTVTRHIRRHMRKTAFSQAAVPREQDFRYYSRPSINRAPCYWPEPMPIYRRVPPPYITRGELVRLVSSASRLIVATEAVQLAPELQDASRATANSCQSKNHISLPRIQYAGENKKNHKKLWVKSGDAVMPGDRTLPQKPESSVSTRGLCERGRRNSSGTHRKKLTLSHERPTISKSASGQGRKSDADTSSQSGNSQKKGPDCVKGERKTATESAAGREGDEIQGVRVSTGMDLPLEEVADRCLSGSCRGTGEVRGKEDQAETTEQDLHVVESVRGYNAESSFSLGQMRDQCSPADDGKKDGESLFVLEKGGNTAPFMRFQALPEGENESNLTGQPGNMGSDPGQGRIFTPTFLSHCNSEDRAWASTEDVPQRPSLLSRCLALSGDTDTSTSQSLSDEEGAEVPSPHSGRQRKDAAHGHAAVVPGDEEDETKVTGKSVPVILSGISVERNDSTQSSEEAIFDFENLTPSLDQNENLLKNMVGNHSHDNLSPQQNQRDEMPHREEGILNLPVTHKDQTILGSSKQNIVHIDNNPMSCLSDKNQEMNNHPGELDLDLDEENFPPFSPEEFLNPPSLRASPRDTDTMDILLSDTRSVLSDVSDTGLLSKEDKDPSVMETCSP